MSLSSLKLAHMHPRNPHEPHRVASVLELFFDLVFVIAVSTLSAAAHHALAHGEFVQPILMYLLVFEFIWWAWMNFTWFASSFDTDDWFYRVLTFLQMIGVLVLAAGIEPMFVEFDFHLAAIGYVIMRLAMVTQWARAYLSTSPKTDGAGTVTDSHHIGTAAALGAKRAARIYAIGILIMQVLWVLWAFFLPEGVAGIITLLVLVAGELGVCYAAERRGPTLWHPHHITERFGLFTIILLGESLLASATALINALHTGEHTLPLIILFLCSFIVSACLWWMYFWPVHHRALTSFKRIMAYGYLHYFVFASAGALSVGTELAIDFIEGGSHLTLLQTKLVYFVPVLVFIAGVWALVARKQMCQQHRVAFAVTALLFIALAFVLPVSLEWWFALPAAIMIIMTAAFVIWEPKDSSSQGE